MSQPDHALVETPLDSQRVYEGKFLKVEQDRVRLPNGQETVREYITHPGAVMIIPLFDDGRVLLERQFRYAIGEAMIEFPAGKLDPNEGALACGVRELREETGYEAKEWTYLGRIHPVISYSTEIIDMYLARGLSCGEACLDDGEFLEVFTASASELLNWVRNGRVTDTKTMIGAFWVEKILDGSWPLTPSNPDLAVSPTDPIIG